MKNLLIICMLAIPFLGNAQNDRVYWLHGFGGGVPGRWQLYEQNFQNSRQLTSSSPSYENNFLNGVLSSANTVDGQIVNSTQNVIIGHSMGGIVSRELERSFPGIVGGIVTVASPNKGVHALNSIRSNQVIPAIEAGFQDLVAGPSADITINALTVTIAGRTIRQLTDEVYVVLLDMVNNRFVDITRQTATELSPNSSYLNTLNNRNANIPILNIICEENDEQGLRIGAAALNPPEEEALHSFDDGELVGRRNQAASYYKAFKDTYNVLRWTGGIQFAYYTGLKNKYARGENFLKVNFAADFNTIIGAVRTETYTDYRYVYKCDGGDLDPLPGGRSMAIQPLPLPGEGCDPVYDIDCPPPSDDCRVVAEYYTATRRVNEGSDGLVPLSTQRMDRMADRDVYTAEGVNHLEVGNHPRMTEILNTIFNKTSPPFNRPERSN
ncbi:alpha/beta hydrolase [Marivirga sp. S37H4]|uniref:Alpha/beta hydrolase n=1 Tax=Marivirga aurantiaca TaxID=2802615 RepID=A0A934X0G8_9BACT|nr:alpha/beta hydrolase [Marivirga aurantiaca]MBK6266101.1 alpha/beta hydrolase [Marivirga aurantiaca]